MKIEVKNIKTNMAFSEETTCFTADIFVNGVKTAYARNDGRGGCTNINSYHKPNDDENLRLAEAYAKSLPKIHKSYFNEGEFLDVDLEMVIDDAIEDHLNAKEKSKNAKLLIKHMETDVCYGIPNTGNYKRIGFPKYTLAELMKHENGRIAIAKLVTRIKGELKEGEVIHNTNIPV